MEITINVRLTADQSLVALLTGLLGGSGKTEAAVVQMNNGATKVIEAAKPAKEQATTKVTESVKETKSNESIVEQMRTNAQLLMSQDKAKLKALLNKFNAKTVAHVKDEDQAAFLKELKEAVK